MQPKAKPAPKSTLAEDEIRVLEYDIQLSQNSGILACRTVVLKLQDNNGLDADCPSFTALSYVWRDSDYTFPIVCDGSTARIALNLRNALTIIWRVYPTIRLWADALSITQDNLLERNHQVSFMGDIFRSARQVFVFLRAPLRGNHRFWALLQSFAAEGNFDSPEFEDELDQFMEGRPSNISLGFHDLVKRPWFQRAWILLTDSAIALDRQTYQEIRLAKDATAICGDSFMPWDTLVGSLRAFDQKGVFLPSFLPLRTLLKEQAFISKAPNKTKVGPQAGPVKAPLLDLLIDGWSRDASDARDKIYAFNSRHLTSSSYSELRPDYTLDVRSTYIRFIRVYINHELDLNFLRFARGVDEPIRSWRRAMTTAIEYR